MNDDFNVDFDNLEKSLQEHSTRSLKKYWLFLLIPLFMGIGSVGGLLLFIKWLFF